MALVAGKVASLVDFIYRSDASCLHVTQTYRVPIPLSPSQIATVSQPSSQHDTVRSALGPLLITVLVNLSDPTLKDC